MQITLLAAGGIDSLCDGIGVRLKSSPNFSQIGFVFDADENPVDRWKRVGREIVAKHRAEKKSRLEKIIPEKPVSGGVWVSDEELVPTVGMWMMPDNRKPGAIEELLFDMIPQDDPRWALAEKYIRAATGLDVEPEKYGLSENKVSKAKIYAWLAVQKEPGIRPGSAVGTRYFDTEVCKAQQFLHWLRELRLELSE